MEPVTITHPDTGRTATIYPTPEAVARFEARGYDVSALKPRKAKAGGSKRGKASDDDTPDEPPVTDSE